MTGDQGDLENGGKYSVQHIANNVTHLDPTLGIQVTSSRMEKVERDTVYPESAGGSGEEIKEGT